jgi:hypothetical protein
MSRPMQVEEAIAAYCAAFKEWTREKAPLDWAVAKMNLGLALATLGGVDSGTERLEEAAAAYREALKEFDQERTPDHWQMARDNLDHALLLIANRQAQAGASPGK